jgi:pimeloyl-ACP methyl ester carboxylesterase
MPIKSEIYYYDFDKNLQDSRAPLILLHGAGGTHLQWPHVIRRMVGYSVFSLDLPGHGKSVGRGFQSIEQYSDRVIDWMVAVGLHSAIFIGHSMGGAISLTCALNYPDQVKALVLIGTGSRLQVSLKLLESASSQTTYNTAVNQIIEWSFSTKSPTRMRELASKRMLENRSSILFGDLTACNHFDITNRLDKIQQPSLILCGTEDKMTPPRLSRFLASSLPGSRLELIPDAGHMVPLERSQLIASSIQKFLAEILLLGH